MVRRVDRINGLLQEEISRIIQKELRDPRLRQLVTITRVETTADLQHATISVSALGGADEEKEALAGLKSATGFLRRELGQRLQLRHTPQLKFVPDLIIKEGDHVLSILDEIRTEETPETDDR
ncbi:MAG: 30S ribosome-binding factor RbfA [Dehalococcoidia bacterium]